MGRQDWTVLALLTAIRFVLVLGMILPPPLLPSMANSLDIPVGLAGLIVTALTGAGAVSAVVGGPLLDHYGRKRFLVWGLLCMGGASLAFAGSPNFAWLFCTHMVFGACLTLAWVAVLSYVGDYYPYERRATAMGITSIAVGAASMIGALVGLALTESYGWRWTYVLLGGLCLLVAAGMQRWVPQLASSAGELRHLAETYATSYSHIIRARGVVGVILAGGIFFLAHSGFGTYFPAWVSELFSLSPTGLIPVVAISGMASVLGGPLSGMVADRLGKKRLVVPCMIVIAFLWWTISAVARSYTLVLAVFALASLAIIFVWTSLTTWVTGLVPDRRRGSLMALHVTLQRLGSALGAAVGGWLFESRGFGTVALGAGIGAIVALIALVWPRQG